MFFKLNQSKKFQRDELMCAFFNGFTAALLATVLLYSVTDLVLIELLPDVDFILNPFYYLIFACVFSAITASYMILWHRTKKGVEITDSSLIFSVGYRAKGIPLDFPRLYGTIELDDIIDVDYMEYFRWREVMKKDYRNYNYSWYFIGASERDYHVARVKVSENGIESFYLFPLEEIDTFIDELKRRKKNKCN